MQLYFQLSLISAQKLTSAHNFYATEIVLGSRLQRLLFGEKDGTTKNISAFARLIIYHIQRDNV